MLTWQKGKIIQNKQVAEDMKSLVVKPEIFLDFKAGQHYEICLPNTNIIRKYSIVSDIFTKDYLEFGIQLIKDGALSPKLWGLNVGDEVEFRGPIGQSFIWEEEYFQPLVLIGAGSGITPLLSIYNSYIKKYPNNKIVFIMSAKNKKRIMNYEPLKDVLITKFTETEKRIDFNFLQDNLKDFLEHKNARFYISGPDNFVDDIVDFVTELGFPDSQIKSERFI